MPLTRTADAVAALLVLLSAAGGAQAQSHRVEITTDADYRTIRSNRIPEHASGRFPNLQLSATPGALLDRGTLGGVISALRRSCRAASAAEAPNR
jgi:hypothetical protein